LRKEFESSDGCESCQESASRTSDSRGQTKPENDHVYTCNGVASVAGQLAAASLFVLTWYTSTDEE
jgi:hypothetical protein